MSLLELKQCWRNGGMQLVLASAAVNVTARPMTLVPSRAAFVLAVRDATDAIETQCANLLEKYLVDHPDMTVTAPGENAEPPAIVTTYHEQLRGFFEVLLRHPNAYALSTSEADGDRPHFHYPVFSAAMARAATLGGASPLLALAAMGISVVGLMAWTRRKIQ